MQPESNISNRVNSEREAYHRRKIIRSFTARANAHRTRSEKIADWMTSTFGSMGFLISNFLIFVLWIILNLGLVSSFTPFDPYPFNLLTTIVSLEAIILAVFVLISQNRASKVDDLREEVDLHIDIMSEKEITKILELQKIVLDKLGVDLSHDVDLAEMLQATNTTKIEKVLEKDIIKNHSR